MRNRYDELLNYIHRVKPSTIVEIGTWNGDRAIAMSREALKHSVAVHYTGYSLFEDGNEQTDAEEFNVKLHVSLSDVKKRLQKFRETNPGFNFQLVKGNTRDTLRDQKLGADFAFIDGGHSVETIANDYAALAKCRFIVFDDYYSDLHATIDITKVGCNQLVDALMLERRRVSIVPPRDKVKGGGWVQLAVLDNR